MKKSIIRECVRISKSKNSPRTHPEWGNFHHFSFIVQDNKILGWATNKTGEASKVLGFGDKNKIHSEPSAYAKAKGLLNSTKSFECVNIRLTRLDRLKISKPCDCCFRFLKIMGCSFVYFSTESKFMRLTL